MSLNHSQTAFYMAGLGSSPDLPCPALSRTGSGSGLCAIQVCRRGRTAHINTNQLSTTRRSMPCWLLHVARCTSHVARCTLQLRRNAICVALFNFLVRASSKGDTGHRAGVAAQWEADSLTGCGMQLSKRKSSPHPRGHVARLHGERA